jgi:hypothetical protein
MSAISRHHRGGLVAAALGIAAPLALAACTSSPSTAPPTTTSHPAATTTTVPATTTTAVAAPPCTKEAITAGIQASPNNGLQSVNGFGCSGSWAWAGVSLGSTPQNTVDAVMVLSASGSAWSVANRATACSQHLVPSDIYTAACTTS